MRTNTKKAVLAVAALAVQCVCIGWLIWRYERVVRHGTEVRFRCEAYDPYDPLRGRYLRTTVRESCTNLLIEGEMKESWRGYTLYAKLEQGTNALWHVTALAESPQTDGGIWVKREHVSIRHMLDWATREKDESYEAFEKRRKASPLAASVEMPNQLFVNEHLAPKAEEVLREATSAKGKGAVAVYRVKDGEIVITDIEIDGVSVVEKAKAAKSDSNEK